MQTITLPRIGLPPRPVSLLIRQLLSRSLLCSTPPHLRPIPPLHLLECPLHLPLWPMPSALLRRSLPTRSTSRKTPLRSSTRSSGTLQFSHYHVRPPLPRPFGTTSNHPRSFTYSRHSHRKPSNRVFSQYRWQISRLSTSAVQTLAGSPSPGQIACR